MEISKDEQVSALGENEIRGGRQKWAKGILRQEHQKHSVSGKKKSAHLNINRSYLSKQAGGALNSGEHRKPDGGKGSRYLKRARES